MFVKVKWKTFVYKTSLASKNSNLLFSPVRVGKSFLLSSSSAPSEMESFSFSQYPPCFSEFSKDKTWHVVPRPPPTYMSTVSHVSTPKELEAADLQSHAQPCRSLGPTKWLTLHRPTQRPLLSQIRPPSFLARLPTCSDTRASTKICALLVLIWSPKCQTNPADSSYITYILI